MEKPDEVLELFRYIERSYDIDKIRYKGLNMWPLLRKAIGFHLSLKIAADDYKAPVARQRSLTDLLKIPFRFYKLFLAKKRFLRSIPLFSTQHLFCTYPDSIFIDQVGGKSFSRYLDPYFEILEDLFKMERFSAHTEESHGIDPLYPIRYLDLSAYKAYYYLRAFISPASDEAEVRKIRGVLNDINDLVHQEYGIRPVYAGIIHQFEEVIFYKEFTDAFIKKNAHVKAIFMECFYDAFKLALVASAKNEGVNVVEIQHGGAEDNVYVPYTKPAAKMDFLPEYFWCWSHSDRELIERHNSSNCPYLKPFVGGNMWLKKFICHEIPVPPEHAAFISAVKLTYKKTVLLSLQLSIGLVDVMFNMISHAPKDVFFLVRFHPLTSREERNEISRKLNPFENVETDMASAIHLYHLFNYIDFQVTHSSTTAMEALSFQVPTIICSEFGYDYYKTQVEQGVLFFATSEKDILEIIAGNGSLDFKNVAHFLIQTDSQQALENLEAAFGRPVKAI